MDTLLLKIVALYDSVGLTYNRLDLTMDLELAMNEQNRFDLAAMIDYFQSINKSDSYIVCNISHDLAGFRAIYQNRPGSEGFLPRSSGYTAFYENSKIRPPGRN